MSDFKIKLYSREEIAEVVDKAEEFYCNYFDFPDVRLAFTNSQMLVLAFDGEKIIGIARLIGDGVRFGIIVGLVVDTAYRNLGIGTKLIRALAENAGTHYINLNTDPADSGLENFYKKAGFKLSKGEQVFEWPK